MSYGGHRLDVLAATGLKRGQHKAEVPVLVQKSVPNNLLLDTGAQSQLGFSLLMKTSCSMARDLLKGEEYLLQ